MMPQWDLLDFIARTARRYPAFDLRMSTEATAPAFDASGRVSGVTLASGETLPARLVIAAAGRRSILRAAAQLPLDDPGAPMDVLWRTEARRVGKECGRTCSSRWSPYPQKKQ